MGAGKSINEVRATVDAVEKWAETPNGFGEDFPHIEFLPDIDKVLYPPNSGRKAQKPLAPTTSGPSSSPAVISTSAPAKNPLELPRKNPARRVKRSASNAFEDEAADVETDEDATVKRNQLTRRPQLQANRPAATTKTSLGRKRIPKSPPERNASGLEDVKRRRVKS